MSGKPYPEGVAQVREAVATMAYSQQKAAELGKIIAEQQAEKERHESNYQTAKEGLFRLMREMDVESRGSAGWEGRFGWFIAELFTQIQQDARSKP